MPFFFLLVDSVLLSALAAFSDAAVTGAIVPPVPVVACVRPEASGVEAAGSGAVPGGALAAVVG
jgi:hypothetical protein